MGRKTLLERGEAIFTHLERNSDKKIYKSDLKKIGLDVNSTEQWIKLIQYIQSKQKLRVIEAGKYKILELEVE